MGKINFFKEEIDFKLPNRPTISRWIKSVIEDEGFKLGNLNYIFCNDAYLLKINQEYLNHDTFTDIVTFNTAETDTVIEGDIFISIDRVRENAGKLSVTEQGELFRVMIHGVLHLLGYSDKTATQKVEMRKKEDACLSLLTKS